MKRKRILIGLAIVAALVVTTILLCDQVITRSAKGKLYDQVSDIPYRKTGLLLGTSRLLSNGKPNPYYYNRIDAAVALLRAGKIKYLVISGDNSHVSYNEPAMMKADLVKAGIDSAVLYEDYAGFRTFDSMIRVKEVFGQDSVTVISQPFHNERALYIAQKEDISAIGFNAQAVTGNWSLRVQAREKLARVKVFLDYLFGTEPKFLGKKIQIPS